MKVVIASHNRGKIEELQSLMKSLEIELIPQAKLKIDEVEENGLTFIENALKKARHAAEISQLPAIADDSGIIVPYLKGAPGIHSARYAGNPEANIHKLLQAMHDVPDTLRDAYFYCVLVFLRDANDPAPLVAEGRWHGRIANQRQGDRGFGYDPIFFVPSENKMAAELPMDLKNKISHRGIAMQAFIKQLSNEL